MPLVQKNINRVNRVIENILDQPIVIRVMSPMQPIANTITTRYLDYAMPREIPPDISRPVSYSVIDSSGQVAWDGDTARLALQPEHRRKNLTVSPAPRRPVSYSVIDVDGNVSWEGDTDLLPLHLQRRSGGA